MGRQTTLESPSQRQGSGEQVECISGNCCDPSTWPNPWDMRCIRCIFCPDDAAMMAQAATLTIEAYTSIVFKDWLFTGGTWTRVDVPAGGYQEEGKIVLDANGDCHAGALTLYHELQHSIQPDGMQTYDAEVDAYTEAEKFSIRHGLRNVMGLRRTDEFGSEVPSERAIHNLVMEYYFGEAAPEGAPPTEQIAALSEPTNETQWRNLATNELTWRPSEEGDYMQTNEVTKTGPGVIPASEFRCPA